MKTLRKLHNSMTYHKNTIIVKFSVLLFVLYLNIYRFVFESQNENISGMSGCHKQVQINGECCCDAAGNRYGISNVVEVSDADVLTHMLTMLLVD